MFSIRDLHLRLILYWCCFVFAGKLVLRSFFIILFISCHFMLIPFIEFSSFLFPKNGKFEILCLPLFQRFKDFKLASVFL